MWWRAVVKKILSGKEKRIRLGKGEWWGGGVLRGGD